MKKRIFTFALAVALLITLIPGAAVFAASEFVPSDDIIAAIKKWEGFSEKPYWDHSQWTVGYGTRVPDGMLDTYKAEGISEEEAEALLRTHLETTTKSLNSFADKYSLTWTQGQFDALLSLSFNCGTAWLYKASTLRTSIIEGWKGNDLLFALGQWSTAGGATLPALIRRRLSEANMYLNGVYSTTVPQDYCYVRFNANGGETEIITQCYDSDTPAAIRAVPQREGYTFEGWYTDATGGEKITTLDAGVRNYTLYAHWSAGGSDVEPEEEITGTAVNYQRQITTGELNSFDQPLAGALVVNRYEEGQIVKIVAEYTDPDQVKWGKIEGGGWINLSYTRDPEISGTPTGGVKVTVTNNAVNVRRGPGTSYARVGSVNKGDQMTITETANGSGYFWGKYEKGWIALKYTNYDEVVNGNEEAPELEPDKEETADQVIATGKVAVNSGKLNIRKGPGTGYASVGGLSKGTAVEIFERKMVGSMEWGRIDKGWISLTYVKLDAPAQEGTPDTEPDDSEDADTDTKPDTGDTNTDTGSTPAAVTGKVKVTSGRLNVRSGPGTNYSAVTSLAKGTAVTITEQKTVNGTAWGKMEKGWVCMKYIVLDSASDSESGTQESIRGTVSTGGSQLRVRATASASGTIVGYLNDGDSVTILEKKTVSGTVWGRISKGWISMQYVKVQGSSSEPAEPAGKTVTVTASCLLIRSGAGTSNQIVGRLYRGDQVTVLETKAVGDAQWGRISKGWICLDYTK